MIEWEGRPIHLIPTKILAAAKNYRAHAAEMKTDVPKEPKFFLKPPSSLLYHEGTVILPAASHRVDYEVELAAIIKDRCRSVSVESALSYVLGYTVFVDVTARDLQAEAMKEGMPWSISKGFDTFAPIGPRIVPAAKLDPHHLHIWLKVNGVLKQDSNTEEMVFTVAEMISYLSRFMTLEPWDIIATGTPERVGPLNDGDLVEAGIEGIGVLHFRCAKEQ